MADYQAEPVPIKMDAEKRSKLALRIKDMIDASAAQKGNAPNGWWKSVEQAYRGEVPDDDDLETKTIQQIRMPHGIRPRTDTLNGQLSTVITRQNPYMTVVEGVAAEVARRKEKLNHRLWKDAGFASVVAANINPAILLNRCVYRVYPEYGDIGGRPGVCIEPVHPQDFFPFPLSVPDYEWALAGHRSWRRVGTLKEKMEAGTYFDISGKTGKPLQQSDPSQYDETGAYAHSNTTVSAMSPEDDSKPIRVDYGQVRLNLSDPEPDGTRKGKEQWYRYVLAYDSIELLSLSEYKFTHCEYFTGFLLADLLMFWSGNSLGRGAYPLQDMGDKLWSTFYTMAQNAAKRLIVGPGGIDGSAHVEAAWGEYYGSDEVEQPTSFAITPQLEPIITALEMIQRLLDMNFRVSQNTMGTIQGQKTLATTDSIVAAGVQVGIEQLLSNFSTPFPAMACHTEEIASHMLSDIYAYYGEEALGCPPEQMAKDLSIRTSWETTGRSPSSTPEAKLNHAMVMAKLAEDPEYGYDKYTLGKTIAAEGPLSGTEGIQKTMEQMQQEAQAVADAEAQAQKDALAQEQQAKQADSETTLAHNVVGKLVEHATRPPTANGQVKKPVARKK